jgi:2-oxoglutarate dehydrogenase E2 component (dihydrolipoamide succinyltransferase)
MTIEVKVPVLPESVADATVVSWHVNVGDTVERDQNLVDLETDKVVLEVPAPASGVIKEIKIETGTTVEANQLLAILEEGTAAGKSAPAAAQQPESEPAPAADQALSPAVRRMVTEHNIDINQIQGSGKDGRIVKEDVEKFLRQGAAAPARKTAETPVVQPVAGERLEKRVPMSRLRARIAERLVEAQHNAAMLTTFNEVNLQAVMDLRARYKDSFEKQHGVRLGFMSFFTKAVVEALKKFPAVNASIEDQDIVYHGYYDIGMAVSTERGLVVPVVRDADQLSMGDIEKAIVDFAGRAKEGKLGIEEMQGGTFTITNGGVFGSLLSTPILNPPQAAILGMHKIEQRAMVENGEIVIRPMMYVALTYDHRLIDGKESVQFLVAVKQLLEDPARLLLNV